MGKDTELEPALVTRDAGSTQDGDIRARWAWVESCVWTRPMLTALEKGVKGGVWFSLMDKVYAPRNLAAAFERVRRNKGSAGVDHETVERFDQKCDEHLARLHRTLKKGEYSPQAIKRTWIPKPGSSERRPLGIPTVRDRVAQTALRNVLEPIFERTFAEHSYGFRPGRGCKDALRRVCQLMDDGHHYVVDADLKGYFDSIPHGPLLERVNHRVSDGRVLELVTAYLQQGVLEGMKKLRDTIRAKTKRRHGHSMTRTIAELNPTLRGWYDYFKHSHWNVFPSVDGWTRMRLRSILRKRRHGRGRGRGADHHRWPNAYFADLGPFSLQAARRTAVQSSKR